MQRKTKKEIHEGLCEACGGSAVMLNTVYRWLKHFFDWNTFDDQHSGRPIEVTNKFHIEKVKELLNEDRQYTRDELVENVDISHRLFNTMLTRHLKMLAARWMTPDSR